MMASSHCGWWESSPITVSSGEWKLKWLPGPNGHDSASRWSSLKSMENADRKCSISIWASYLSGSCCKKYWTYRGRNINKHQLWMPLHLTSWYKVQTKKLKCETGSIWLSSQARLKNCGNVQFLCDFLLSIHYPTSFFQRFFWNRKTHVTAGNLFVHVGYLICRQSWYKLFSFSFEYQATLNTNNPMITVRYPSLNVSNTS